MVLFYILRCVKQKPAIICLAKELRSNAVTVYILVLFAQRPQSHKQEDFIAAVGFQ